MAYFSYFPQTYYSFDTANANFALVTNVLTRAKIIKEVLNNSFLYYKYEIKEGETPEIVAYNFYGDAQKHWIILYANSIIDPKYEWVLHSKEFDNYIIAKYGSLEDAKTELHHYEVKIEESNSIDGRINERIYTVTDKTFNFTTKTASDRFEGGAPTLNSPPIKVNYNYTLSDDSIITGTETYSAISNYDHEFIENEKRRNINILNPDYAAKVENELRDLLR
jgi:hypothetical protein